MNIYWSVWCGWYEYGKYIGVDFDNEKYDLFINFNSEINFFIPYKGICFISEKPIEINWNNNRLHKDGGMSVKYSDGWGIYTLNGVAVPDWLAKTPEGKLTIKQFKSIKNADIKAEFIRKYGVERLQSLGEKICDAVDHHNEFYRQSEYEIWDMGKAFDNTYRPFLKMRNLTTGIYHFEGIHPDCRTIEQALKFRTKNRLTELKGVK